jgi:hypothetical protein
VRVYLPLSLPSEGGTRDPAKVLTQQHFGT